MASRTLTPRGLTGLVSRSIRQTHRPRPPRSSDTLSSSSSSRRTLVAAPRPGSGPLMARRSDRALPDINTAKWHAFKTVPLFLAAMGLSSLVIFNYQKLSSSVVASTLYALRTSDQVRTVLGDEVYYANSAMPWVWGKIDQFHGKIDVSFRVKGTKAAGLMRFRSSRPSRNGFVSAHLVPISGLTILILFFLSSRTF